jgi:hypothetical protein
MTADAAHPMEANRHRSANLDAALRLASAGIAIFPAQPDKRPQPGLRWKDEATTDGNLIRQFWQRWPDSLPAFEPGRHGLVVIDGDRHGGPDGVASLEAFQAEEGRFPESPITDTAGGGVHIYFRQPTEGDPLGNREGAIAHKGINVRGAGGYVIAPGATLSDGREWSRAEGAPDLCEAFKTGAIPEVPLSIVNAIRAPRIAAVGGEEGSNLATERLATLASPDASGAVEDAAMMERGKRAAAAALASEAATLAAMGPDSGRNEALNGVAFRMARFSSAGWIDLRTVNTALLTACERNGLVKEDGRTACQKTFISGWQAGSNEPPATLSDRPSFRTRNDGEMVEIALEGRRIIEQDGVRIDAETGEVASETSPNVLATAQIAAEPFVWTDPAAIPPRAWLYGKHYIRGFVSSTVAPGGVGKSALTMCEAIAIATGRELLGVEPAECVPVWLLNLEDPMDELYRRAMAIAMRHGLTQRDITGRIFLNSGRVTKLTIATTTKAGTVVVRPVVEGIVAEVRRHGIGLIIIDPFVASHAVPENDNPAINVVVSAWRDIAERTGCAVELVHHTRKTLGGPITTQDGRGGNALEGCVRSMRALNRMTPDEAAKAGVENHRSFFRIDDADGKANMSPPSSKATWYELKSVDLGNATADRSSDHVGVVTRWSWPDPLSDITPDHVRKVCAEIDGGSYRKDVQATNWAGHVVGDVIGVDTGRGIRSKDALTADHRAARAKVSGLLSIWLKSGALRVEIGMDNKGNERPFVRAGEPCGE